LQEIQQAFPDKIYTETFDVTGTDNIPRLESLIRKTGGMDLLLYNAGYGEVSSDLNWTIEQQTTAINVNGFLEILHFAFHYFVKQGHGHIAATSSVASVRGNGMAPAYSASKAFMSTYLEGLQLKTAKEKLNIAVTDLQPGFVKTKMAKGHGQFWVAPVDKAARQIFAALEQKKRRAYITKRWIIIAWLMKRMPYWLYRRIVSG
jgi:short-subunit dehydrogenase